MKPGKIFFLVTVILFFISCKVRTPKGIIPADEMENLLYDYHEAQAIAKNTDNATRNTDIYTEAVLQKYEVNRAEFNKSMQYYSRHADQLYKIYSNLEKRFQNEVQAYGGNLANDGINHANLSTHGDTANIWVSKSYSLLTPKPGKNRFEFQIKADTSFMPKDRYEWHFNTLFVYKEGRKNAQTVLSVIYSNDSITTIQQPIYGDGENVISLQSSNLPIKRIEGFIYLDEPWNETTKLLFISRISLIRFHSVEPKNLKVAPAVDSVDNAKKAAEKKFIDSIQQSAKNSGKGDHFRSVTRKRATPRQKE